MSHAEPSQNDAPEAPPTVATPPGRLPASAEIGGLCVLAAIVAGALMTMNIVTIGFALLISLGALQGYCRGSLRMLSFVVGLLVGFLVAQPVGAFLETPFRSFFGFGGMMLRATTIGAAGLGAIIVVSIVASVVTHRLSKSKQLAVTNRTSGMAIGAAEGALVAFGVVWSALALAPVVSAPRFDDTGRLLSPPFFAVPLQLIANSADESVLGAAADATNPVGQVEVMQSLNDFAIVAASPELLEEFLEDPQVQAIQERESVQRLRKDIEKNEEIHAIVARLLDDGLQEGDIWRLLNSDEFSRILASSGALEDLDEIAGSLHEVAERVRRVSESGGAI